MEDKDNSNQSSSPEKTLAFNLQQEVAVALGRSPQGIELCNLDAYIKGRSRFLILKGFTRKTDEKPAGFFKMSTDTTLQTDPEVAGKSKKQISNEWSRTKFALANDVPCVRILTDCRETASGKTILELEQIDPDSGTFIPAELVETADPVYGKRAAIALMAVSGKEIPPDVSTDGVSGDDWRNKSLESFLDVWHESDKIFDRQYTDVVSKVVPLEKLKQITAAALSELTEEIPKHLTPDRKYFVHNDVAPNNLFFQDASVENEAKTLFLDFEWAGYTNNRYLAQLTDCGNFYGRLWANKDMQQTFIQGVINAPTQDSLEYRYQLAKASIVFGTIYLAKYGIDPNHKEHQMSVKLLKSLEENLAFLDTSYETHQTVTKR